MEGLSLHCVFISVPFLFRGWFLPVYLFDQCLPNGFVNAEGACTRRATTINAKIVRTAGAMLAKSDPLTGMMPRAFHCKTVALTKP
jgi:hypothetical protein